MRTCINIFYSKLKIQNSFWRNKANKEAVGGSILVTILAQPSSFKSSQIVSSPTILTRTRFCFGGWQSMSAINSFDDLPRIALQPLVMTAPISTHPVASSFFFLLLHSHDRFPVVFSGFICVKGEKLVTETALV